LQQYPCPANFSIEVSPGDGETKSGTYRTHRSKEFITQITNLPEAKTAFDILAQAVKKYAKNNFHGLPLGDAKYQWKTYEQVFSEVQAFGSGLMALNALSLDATKEMKVMGLVGRNHPSWMVAEYGCLGFSGSTVPFYDSLSPETLQHLINDIGLTSVVCDEPSAKKLLEAKRLGIDSLNLLIVYGYKLKDAVEAIAKEGKDVNVQVLTFEEVVAKGKQNVLPFQPPGPDTIFSFVFTSGSTGKFPKAALLKHSCAVANVASILFEYDCTPNFSLTPGKEVHLSFLPCAHAMERTSGQTMMASGSAIAYSQGIREKVMEEVASVRPTLFVCVPRILNRLHDKILSGAQKAGGIKTTLFMNALEKKKQGVAHGYLKHPFYDGLVFNPLKKKLGLDRCHRILTGSAPIAGEVLDFLRAVFGSTFIDARPFGILTDMLSCNSSDY
jgi:long-chain acyl-CoA synthetase